MRLAPNLKLGDTGFSAGRIASYVRHASSARISLFKCPLPLFERLLTQGNVVRLLTHRNFKKFINRMGGIFISERETARDVYKEVFAARSYQNRIPQKEAAFLKRFSAFDRFCISQMGPFSHLVQIKR